MSDVGRNGVEVLEPLMCGSGSELSGQLSIYYPKGLSGQLLVFDYEGRVCALLHTNGTGGQDFSYHLSPGKYSIVLVPDKEFLNSLLGELTII